jgi:hypothetical protein
MTVADMARFIGVGVTLRIMTPMMCVFDDGRRHSFA